VITLINKIWHDYFAYLHAFIITLHVIIYTTHILIENCVHNKNII